MESMDQSSSKEAFQGVAEVDNRAKGEIGETLVRSMAWNIKLPDHIQEVAKEKYPEAASEATQIQAAKHSGGAIRYAIKEDCVWKPDLLFSIQFFQEDQMRPFQVKFPIDVKTGPSSGLAKNQRRAIEEIKKREDEIIPCIIWIDISELPEKFEFEFEVY